ncbi:protein-tyrosine-phosphatase [Actinopolyspora erythraea]|uniref:Protein tyrosine phosphatase n=1 Tax=Actinopolyspora erythraea TaxID=414996 RepID=A0A099D507_9ACTN|nr:tyrosine-protein phosphatase [Actinopolyspora erythraea]ASU79515.1 protein-tyrosine-phosphatase [Actinopolyspora erythraea]KGI81099.1 protein tyrosine phosphatase [Actinopolyspora erythraea]
MAERSGGVPNGLVNFRDLGGLPVENGVTTRHGVLLRGDAPYEGDRHPEEATHWPPRAVIDLRDTGTESDAVHPLEGVSTVHRIPLLEGLRGESGEDPWLTLSELYGHMLDFAPKRLLETFRIAVETDGPVLVHCAAGKDRTGVVCALLLRTAGVRYDAVVADYTHTDRNMSQVLRRLRITPELPPGVEESDVNELVSAPAYAIEHALQRVESHRDGAAGWLMRHGASPDEIESWRRRFLLPGE